MSMRTFALVIVQLAIAQTGLWAQERPIEYASKYVCGTRTATTTQQPFDAVSTGLYHTAVNIHNPHPDTATFYFKVATTQSRPVGGTIVPGRVLRLLSDQALEIDCAEILAMTRGTFAKGFLVIQTARELDVVTVYTAGPRGEVQTMDVERVAARISGKLP